MDLGWTSVKDYGATGNGSTDDTSAITAAIAALPNPGVLYFPPGTYKTSGGFTISTPCLVLGAGGGGGKTLNYQSGNVTVPHISQVQCTSQTAVLFTVSASGVQFHDLSFDNIYAGTPSAGAAIQTVAGGGDHAQYVGCTFHGFYNNLDHQYGREWMVNRCYFLDPVKDGIRSQNLDAADEGECTITSCQFMQQLYGGSGCNAIEILRSGGHRIVGNLFFGLGPSSATEFEVMVKVTISTATSDFLIQGNEMENWSGSAIYITGSGVLAHNIIITGNTMTDGVATANEGIFVNNGIKVNIGMNQLISYGSSSPAVSLNNTTHAVLVGNYWEGYASFNGGTGSSDINATANYS